MDYIEKINLQTEEVKEVEKLEKHIIINSEPISVDEYKGHNRDFLAVDGDYNDGFNQLNETNGLGISCLVSKEVKEIRNDIDTIYMILDNITQQINKIEVLESDPTGNELYEGRIWISASIHNEPDEPDEPTIPDKPDKPDNPDKPDKPDVPVEPDEPDEPTTENSLYIRLDNTTSQTDTSWLDGSGKGNNFTYTEETNDTTCGFNESKALVFNGTNNAMLFIDSYFVGTIHGHKNTDITVEIEFKCTDISKENYLLAMPSWDNGFCFGIKSSKFIFGGNPSLSIDCGTADTNKHIFTFVCGSDKTVIYKDGAKLVEGGKVNIKDITKICIGKSYTQASNQFFVGEVYSFRAYNKMLSESEVVERHNEVK